MPVAARLAGAVAGLPDRRSVANFDRAVDAYWDRHLRGHGAVDLAMYAASAAGDHSLLWLGIAALRARRARRTGPMLRAAAALGAESAIVNGLVKLAFHRQRPAPEAPRPLPLRTPRTSSFPSGHASSAFFAAALLRTRRNWPLCYTLAAAVALSRAHVRIHHPSDVLAGAVLGAALGEAARHWAPIEKPSTDTALERQGGTSRPVRRL